MRSTMRQQGSPWWLVSSLALILLLLAGCMPIQRLPATQTTTVPAAETSLEEANQAVIQRLYEEIINQKDLSVADEIWDAHAVAHDTGDEGIEAAKAGLATVLTGFPDLQVTVDFWVVKGDMVTAQVSFQGTQQGEFLGVAPTNKPVAWTHIDIHRVQHGKITDVWHTIPVADILHQISTPTQSIAVASTETTLEQANQAVVQRFYEEVVNQKKLELFQEVFDPKMTEHSLGFGPELFRDTDLFAGFPDQHLTVDLWMVKDDMVTAVVTVSGTQTGEFIGIAPTGKTVTFSQIDIWRVQNGMITDVWHNFASADILQQVGYTLVPPAQ